MLLLLQHPKVAYRDCEHCQQFEYDEETGKVQLWRGEPYPRHGPPPCRTSVGCAKGTPENSKALSARNWLAYQHYTECKATGQFPDDAIVRQNAGIIHRIEEAHRRGRMDGLIDFIAATVTTRQAGL